MRLTPRLIGAAAAILILLAGGVALGLTLGTGGKRSSSGVPPPSTTAAPPSVPSTSTTSSTTTTIPPTTPAPAPPTTTVPPAPTTSATSITTTSTTTPSTTTRPRAPTTVPAPPTTRTPTTGRPAPPPGTAEPFDRLACKPQFGVRFCPGNGGSQRVPSFDGVPLDADVTLPATGNGPFPLLVLLHGLGENKSAFESKANDGRLDNVTMASQGWAVLNYTARGFGRSCGTAASRQGTPGCARGWIQLADQRYEVRDTEYLAGLLVDEGFARPSFAVAGQSYGAGQSLELAMMKDRVRLLDGKLAPLTSPVRHVPMSVAAAYAEWPWDDLSSSLVPNGWLSSAVDTPPAKDVQPVGVSKQSWFQLHNGITAGNYLAPVGVDPQSDLTRWYRKTQAGEPATPEVVRALHILQSDKSAIGIPMPAGGPAPTAIENGWTDSLFPVSEAQHYVNRIAAAGLTPPLLLMYADLGHGWAQNKPADTSALTTRAIAFLNATTRGGSTPPTGVVALGVTCPGSATSGPALTGASLGALGPRSLSFGSAAGQTVTSGGGNPATAAALNPAYAGKPYCNSLPAGRQPGTAVYTRALGPQGVTLLGAPTVTATLSVKGRFPQLVGRLWDVSANGANRQIVSLGVFRPSVNQAAGTTAGTTATEQMTFHLPPTDYTFAAGHTVQLELVGSNPPLFRKSNGTFTVSVSDLKLSLPTT